MSAYESAPAYRPEPGAAASPRNGIGIAALVLGILAVLLFWTIIGGIVLGLIGLILGIVGFRRGRRGQATNGTMSLIGGILGLLGLIVSAVIIVAGVSLLNSDEFKNLQDCLQHASTTAEQQQCQSDFADDMQG
ncbi:MAG TPA: DUF4190 domain-containing protein [Streptomyces sp.]|jgi:lysylphosphatidylglycerol synthetase-like protein (DUF2156 family)|nr:DUF4190 domain-containing protein [Streptomyces sp.]